MPLRTELGAMSALRPVTRIMPPGMELYRQGESCTAYFAVLSGWIALSVLLDDGACQILDFALPGAFLGFPLASPASMYHSARCLTPVRVCSYSREQVEEAIERNPKLAYQLYRLAGLGESRAHDHLVNLGLRSARERIAHLLLELYVRLVGRLPVKAGETIQLPLTQSHIGQAVGLTGVHVSRTLRTLREQRIARLVNRSLEILDPTALAKAAGLELRSCTGSQLRTATACPRPRMGISVTAAQPLPAGWEMALAGVAA